MPIAKFEMPDGRVAKFEVPDGTTPEEAQRQVEMWISTEGKKEPSLWQSVKDTFTGNDRQTAMSDQTPEIGGETGIADFLGLVS